MNVTEDDLREAIDRIARSRDGRLLYLYFQKVLCGVTNDKGALPEDWGRRRFASELMGLMAKGIEESGGRSQSSRPVVFAAREPGGAGRRVTARDFFAAELAAKPAG